MQTAESGTLTLYMLTDSDFPSSIQTIVWHENYVYLEKPIASHLPTHLQTTQLVFKRCLEVSRKIFKLIHTRMGKLTYIQWIYIKNQHLVKKREFCGISQNSVFRIFLWNSTTNTDWKKQNSSDFCHFFFRRNGNFLSTEFHGNTEMEIPVQHLLIHPPPPPSIMFEKNLEQIGLTFAESKNTKPYMLVMIEHS